MERLEVFKASEKPQEYKDTKNLYDIFESPAAAKLPTGKSKGRFGGCQANRSGDQSGGQSEDGERFRGTEQKNLRGKRQRRNFGNEKELKGEHDLRTCSLENNKVEQRVGYQPNRGRSSRRARGGPTGSLRCGSVQGQSRHRGFRDGDVRMPVPLMPPDLGFGDEDTLHPQGGHGNRGDRGHQPKPKSKDSVRGYRGRVQGGYSQRQGEYQTNGGFQEGDQLSYEQSHFTQRQHYTERGRGQLHQGRRESLGRDATSLFLSDLASGNTGGCRVCDNSDLGRLGGFDSNRLEQANRGRPRDSCNRGRGQRGMRHAQSLSSVVGRDQSSGTGENTEERYGMERRKLRIRGLSESTTDDALTNFIEAISGEEVKEVQRLRNGNAIVTMVNDITSKSIFGVIFIPPL